MTFVPHTYSPPFATAKWWSVTLLAIAQVCALSLWFSATALVPVLKAEYSLSGFHASLFSSGVAMGFVAGTLASALLGLSDRIAPRRLFTICVLLAVTANGAILLFSPTSPAVVALRILTGVTMAGIYPVGMKMVATWAGRDAGLLVGILVGALTLGSASPHLLNLLNIEWLDWRTTIAASSVLAALAAMLVQFVSLGKDIPPAPPFRLAMALDGWRNRAIRLANFGYFGHMWELYAMWAWIGLFLVESYRLKNLQNAVLYANISTFATLAIGALGCLLAGLLADRIGRTTVTIAAMATSGACAVLIGFSFGAAPAWVMVIALVWGFSIVADSAQFSTCIIELSPSATIGTMLTVQTSAGFLISLISIHLLPVFVDLVGWQYAFLPLAIGPLLGCIAMLRLRRLPEAVRIAHGRR